MSSFIDPFLQGVDSFFAWLSASLKQTTESYCDIETADSEYCLVAHDGSLISMIEVQGCKALVGAPEFTVLHDTLTSSLRAPMSRPGHAIQVFFNQDHDRVVADIRDNFLGARETAKKIGLELEDLFEERIRHLSRFCSEEKVFFVLWTRPSAIPDEQQKRAQKEKLKLIREKKVPPFKLTQNIIAAIPELRNAHEAFVRGTLNDFANANLSARLVDVHEAVYHMRMSVDPEFTDRSWRPVLPGDKIKIKEYRNSRGDISDLLWPSLAKQIMPRDAEVLDMRTVRIGDMIYSSLFIDLFPKDIHSFQQLFSRVLDAHVPWRISFLIESAGLSSLRFKALLSSILSWTSVQNRLIADAANLLKYINYSTDDAIVRIRVTASTWAPEGDISLLRTRAAELAKALEGWGECDVSESSGDAFAGVVSSMLGLTTQSVATPSVAPFSDVVYMLPIARPSSPWKNGALLFRSADGKLWPFQPGSRLQTTWIDLIYARPGSGKSVLSNALNLALCLSAGLQRLPRIAIIDIGPSSSGLISLLREALPAEKKHYVAYHRLRMTPDYSINPFDTQLGCRNPTPQERVFLVNFLTLLATPLGADKPYDGISDLAGMVVDELYKEKKDDARPTVYAAGIEPLIDGLLEEINFVRDKQTTWWEITDALFIAGFTHEAMLAQRYAMPLLADAASIVRMPAIEDLYGKIISPTGENLITAFGRMISSAVREYPILSRVTQFDLGDARIISLDLDEVAKTGGDAADRQTAVMYMLARFILAKDYYLSEENVGDIPESYREFHGARIAEIREDPKRLVLDEFHRTSKAEAVRAQVINDMREGRKWKVQVALLSQSLEDFDPIMVEFSTAIYIMDAGPKQAIDKSAEVFGLSETAKIALRNYVHGPSEAGSTFLAQFATKDGINMQLLTLTLGPIELWSFSTTAEDANLRNRLYKRLGPVEARRVLANLFPGGSASREVERRMNLIKETHGMIEDVSSLSVVETLVEDILTAYSNNPNLRSLPR